ncbi:hypothetical protein [Aeromicrobium sp. Leaf291]|uniref:hypothetical protein n=1 Tax=Aeromicrobium sp. Leaf291 TaxID=1736325 RepID=UPI000A5A27E5|nr:hypothetical protein [Aeromicrobium sp. Leaf291]
MLAANPGALRLVLSTAVTMLDGLEADDLEELGFTEADRVVAHRVACEAEAAVLEARP